MAMRAEELIEFISEYLGDFFCDLTVFMRALRKKYISADPDCGPFKDMNRSCKKARRYFELLEELIDKDSDFIYKDPTFEVIPYTEETVELWNSLGITELEYTAPSGPSGT